jgi:hypothetical protein
MQGVRGSNPLSSTTTTPQLNRRVASGLSTPPPPLIRAWGTPGHGGQRHRQPLGDYRDHPRLHRLGHVPVAGTDHAALALAPAAGLVAHQLIDHPGRDAGVLQPGREGVPGLVGAVQVDRLKQGMLGSCRSIHRPVRASAATSAAANSARAQSMVAFTAVRPWALSWAASCSPVSGPWPRSAPGCGRRSAGVPRWLGWRVGQGAVVGAVEVMPRQHRAGAPLDPGATALAGTAAKASEQQGGGIAAGREPAAHHLDHLRRQGDLTDAGVALGPLFEAAAELAACLVANVDDLQGGDGLVEADALAVQAGELAVRRHVPGRVMTPL